MTSQVATANFWVWTIGGIMGLIGSAYWAAPVRSDPIRPHLVRTVTYRCLTPEQISFEIRQSGKDPYQPGGCWAGELPR